MEGARDMEVINAGVPGHSTRDILARLEKDCLSLRPSLVVLKAGTNDALNSHNLVPLSETEANLRAICEGVLACGAKLLICTMLTYTEDYLLLRHGGKEPYGELPPEERFAQLLSLQRSLARELNVPLVDLNVLFTALGEPRLEREALMRNEANCGIGDGVHPNPTGYRVIAAAVWQAILAYKLPTEKIVCLGDSITCGQFVPGEGTAGGETYPGLLAQLLRGSQAAGGV